MSDPFAIRDPDRVCVVHAFYGACPLVELDACERSAAWIDVAAVVHFRFSPQYREWEWDLARFRKLVC